MSESEAGLIAQLRDLFHTSFQTGVEIGIGDDAAVVLASNKKLVATVDMAVEDIHFKREWSTPFQIGAKLTTANLADIFAMGATPKYLLVAAAITEVNNSQMVSELAKGIRSVADKFEVAVIGGDLSRAEKMSLSITALGEISEKPITRSGAKVGDIVYVSALPGLSLALKSTPVGSHHQLKILNFLSHNQHQPALISQHPTCWQLTLYQHGAGQR